jgi:ribosomal protein S12 methylthiotransferase accessory factor
MAAPLRSGEARPAGVQAIVARAGRGEKTTDQGTHRVRPPNETVAWAHSVAPHLGITRVANVTGLDEIGVPVVMVVRPNARGLSVSQGKGLTLDAAKASGLMESIELWHGEHVVNSMRRASLSEVEGEGAIPIEQLPRSAGGRLDRGLQILWIAGVDLASGETTWVPEEVVGTDCSLPKFPGAGCFVTTSNGLASGNHPLEAIVHGLCEVIERDANTLFELRGSRDRRARRLDLSTVDYPDGRGLLDACDRAGVAVAAWDTTTDIGLPSVACEIFDRKPSPWRPLPVAAGQGCHLTPEVAFSRALTEAAQSRLTMIAGSRDEYVHSDYRRILSRESLTYQRSVAAEPATRPFGCLPALSDNPTLAADAEHILERLRACGLDRAIAVDLTRKDVGVPVVRIVVPGLEHRGPGAASYHPGPRGRAVVAGDP